MKHIVLLILLCVFTSLREGFAATSKPNIILVMPDDVGYGDYACLGNPIMRTPSVDAFKKESLLLTQFHVSPTCSPTRSALMSGRHEFKNGVTHTILERERMSLKTFTLPQMLKTAGYTSGIFGKWHLGDEEAYSRRTSGFLRKGELTLCTNLEKQFPNNQRAPMKTILTLFLCLLATPLFAQRAYPPTFKDARVETYRKVGSTELKLWVFGESDPKVQKPAIVFFFGGSWSTGSPAQFEDQARYFAKRGMIATTGTISGFGSDERPNAMILFNPACTLAPIADCQPPGDASAKLSSERLGVEAQAISPAHHIGAHTPPTLILHGKEDTMVPYASVDAFESAMKKAGRPCKLVGYEGAEHRFFNNGEGYAKTLAEADAFLVELGWLKK